MTIISLSVISKVFMHHNEKLLVSLMVCQSIRLNALPVYSLQRWILLPVRVLMSLP